MNTAIAIEPTLVCKVEELQALLNDPRPDDCDWSERLITALEQVADYALETSVPVRALSRTLRASISLPRENGNRLAAETAAQPIRQRGFRAAVLLTLPAITRRRHAQPAAIDLHQCGDIIIIDTRRTRRRFRVGQETLPLHRIGVEPGQLSFHTDLAHAAAFICCAAARPRASAARADPSCSSNERKSG